MQQINTVTLKLMSLLVPKNIIQWLYMSVHANKHTHTYRNLLADPTWYMDETQAPP